MAEIDQRISALPPERRKLLESLMQAQATAQPGMPATPRPASPQESGPGLNFEAESVEPEGVKSMYRQFYDGVTTQLDANVFGEFSYFLNYGYAPDLSPQHAVVGLPEHYLNRNSVKLVLEVIADCPIEGRRILDVGCGRGGAVHVLTHFFVPASVTGLDLSPAAIAFCLRAHRGPRVTFELGDAEHLPFAKDSFDAVINVESSHTYPNIRSFYNEVWRVLAPGGYFLYTDVHPVAKWLECVAYLQLLGFLVEREVDITSNVLLSCDEIARTRVQAFSAANDPDLMKNFLAVPGSEVYDSMQQRLWTYNILKLRKPE
ncbi:MAG TPA: methyltransferase domain-containing protein [Candidatus Tectomicrobia bacterium]|nr:methyltransferase domain-containing protein [Candidatus Tectomicrobia bacterium]